MISSFDNNKAYGPTSIPTNIYKLIAKEIAKPLANIVNLSFATGIFPNSLKIAKITPIYKNKGSKLSHENYRPISLLSNIHKIFEKLMYKRVYSFLSLYNCIYELQFGFQQHHSTDHALLSLTEEIRNALDKNNYCCAVFIDLQKAFDTVDHTILLQKLNHYGIRGICNSWFKSYLSNRKHFVSINGFNSSTENINIGVPQGSVLGPLLFLIYINDLHHSILFCNVRHFADDTNLLISNNSLKYINNKINLDLRFLNNWLKANKISLNTSKTELILFKQKSKIINFNLKIKFNGKKLFLSDHVKYLGIYIDQHLNWNFHIDQLRLKLARANGMLSKIRHYVPYHTLINIYHGISSSHLTYSCIIWGQKFSLYQKSISILQNKPIRIMHFQSHDISATPFYQQSKILKLYDHVKMKNFLLIHNYHNKELPKTLQNHFTQYKNTHSYNTKSLKQNCLKLPSPLTTNFGINSITYKSISTWNWFIKTFASKELSSISKYQCKQILKKYFISNYEF